MITDTHPKIQAMPVARNTNMYAIPLDTTYQPRLWRCDECRRVLGVVMRDANHIRRLWIFTLDCQEDNVPPVVVLQNPPKGLYKVHGADSVSRPGGVECSHCGALNDWKPSQESFDKLMSNFPKKLV